MPNLKVLQYTALALTAGLLVCFVPQTLSEDTGYSLRFFGNGIEDIDRVKIPLEGSGQAVNVSEDFTIELWIKITPDENVSGACSAEDAAWINGNIILDRDVFGAGDYGDFGLSLFAQEGVIGFGISRENQGVTLCGVTNIVDNAWHHIAVTRDNTGLLTLYIDGQQDASIDGPVGDISYREGRSTSWPNDPFLVIGAEKHDYDNEQYPSFSGWIDELHISRVVRYTEDFSRPSEPFTADENSVGLYHFDEGEGSYIEDSSGTGSHGVRHEGGSPLGPAWSEDTPFRQIHGQNE